MQKLLTFTLLYLCCFSLSAQLRLNVDGNARITGRLEIGTGVPAQNTFIGLDNGTLNSGTENTFFGYGAGFFNQAGTANTFIGANAGRLNQSGVNNVYIGKSAGQQTTAGSFNTMIGSQSGTNNTASNNTFIGYRAGYLNTGGGFNTMIGTQAGAKNTAGEKNTFIGYFAGNNTKGSNNTFLGFQAGIDNDAGNDNTFVGQNAGNNNKSGFRNTHLGMNAGFSNFDGFDNTYVGHSAGRSNVSGNRNTFIGANSGYFSNGDTCNTFVGHFAGFSNTNGVNNAFSGYQSGVSNTTGTNNTFYGFESGYSNSTGDNNTFVGRSAGTGSQTGPNNVFVGHVSGRDNNAGEGNTYIGTFAAFSVADGQFLTAFGYNAGASLTSGTSGLENSFAIGSNALMTQSNMGSLGNVGTRQIGGYVNWGTASDGRMKTDVREDVRGLDFILQLHPVTYQIDAEKLDAFMRAPSEGKGRDRSEETDAAEKARSAGLASYQKALAAKSRIRYTGFIAQEVEKAMTDSGFEFSGLVKPAHDKDHYSLRYAEFVVPLVKATQEQQERIEEQEQENQAQRELIETHQQEIKELQSEVTKLKDLVNRLLAAQEDGTPIESFELDPGQATRLSQNYPNPFHQDTTIDYFIPGVVRSARLEIHAVDGRLLATFPIPKTGEGQVQLKAGTYPAGTYLYSLVLDGEEVATKRMVLTK